MEAPLKGSEIGAGGIFCDAIHRDNDGSLEIFPWQKKTSCIFIYGDTQQPWVFLLKMIILGCFGGTTI